MTVRSASLVADLATIPGVSYVGARTVVALSPSDLDPSSVIAGTTYDTTTVYDATALYFATYLYESLRVYVNGSLIHRAYDSEMS